MAKPRSDTSGERYYPVSAVARWLGVTEVSIKNWSNAGKLTSIRTAGGHRRITASSVVAMLDLQGRTVPRELTSARPAVLAVTASRSDLVRHLRRALGACARVDVCNDGYAAAMAAMRVRPEAIVVDGVLPHFDAERWLAALRGEPLLRTITVLLVGDDASGPNVLPRATADEGATRYFRRRDHEGIAAAAGALVRHLAIA
jgi:PleD family two-component response regulator